MKRLRDIDEPSPLVRKAQALIESVPPLPESEQRMLRVRRELERAGGARGARLPAVGLALGVVLFGASAFAAVRIYVAVIAERASTEQSAAAASGKHGPRHAQRAKQPQDASDARPEARVVADAPAPAPASQVSRSGVHTPAAAHAPIAVQGPPAATEVPAAARPAPVEIEQQAEESAPRSRAVNTANPRLTKRTELHTGSRAPTPSATARAGSHARKSQPLAADTQATPAAVASAAAAATSELVHRAVKALRHDHDAALAARLLEEHRARGASGPLAEEALSLQIEAATQLGDARAQQYAREYLTRYPEGRYLGVARRALQDAAP